MIEVSNLIKQYGKDIAVNDISFTVNEGEILGFLGPNGAGKSTTMNIITGYIAPTSGTVRICGYDIIDEPQKAKSKIGYLPEIPPLYVNMTVDEYLDFVCDIKKISKGDKKDVLEKIKDIVKISHVSNKIIKNLSKGYKQRVGIAQALIGNPEILILDEPTVGLDPKEIIEIRDFIKTLGKNHTVILSSHILSEISAVCDRVLILNKGVIVAQDTTENLSENLSRNHKMNISVKGDKENIKTALENEQSIVSVIQQGENEKDTYQFIVEASENCDIREVIFDNAIKNNYKILGMNPVEMSLEDIFLKVTDIEDNSIKENTENEKNDDGNSEGEGNE